MFSGESNPKLFFRVWLSGEPVTTLTIGDLTVIVHRPGTANPSALSLTLVTDETSTTVGAVYHLGGGLCWVNIATGSISSYQGPIVVEGTYTGGSVDGVVAEVSAYDTSGNPSTQTSVDDLPTNAEFAAAFPANFGELGINSSGHVSRVTLTDTTTVNTDMRGTDSASTHDAATVVSAMQVVADDFRANTSSITVSDYASGQAPDDLLPSLSEISQEIASVLISTHGAGPWTTADNTAVLAAIAEVDAGGGSLTSMDLDKIVARILNHKADVLASVEDGLHVAYEKATMVYNVFGCPIDSARSNILYCIKSQDYHEDDQSLILVSETAGLLVAGGKPLSGDLTSADASVSVTGTTVTVTVSSRAMGYVSSGKYYEGAKQLATSDTVLKAGPILIKDSILDAVS